MTRAAWSQLYNAPSDPELAEAWRTVISEIRHRKLQGHALLRAQVALNLLLVEPRLRQYAIASLVGEIQSPEDLALVVRLDELRRAREKEPVLENRITANQPAQSHHSLDTPSPLRVSTEESMNDTRRSADIIEQIIKSFPKKRVYEPTPPLFPFARRALSVRQRGMFFDTLPNLHFTEHFVCSR